MHTRTRSARARVLAAGAICYALVACALPTPQRGAPPSPSVAVEPGAARWIGTVFAITRLTFERDATNAIYGAGFGDYADRPAEAEAMRAYLVGENDVCVAFDSRKEARESEGGAFFFGRPAISAGERIDLVRADRSRVTLSRKRLAGGTASYVERVSDVAPYEGGLTVRIPGDAFPAFEREMMPSQPKPLVSIYPSAGARFVFGTTFEWTPSDPDAARIDLVILLDEQRIACTLVDDGEHTLLARDVRLLREDDVEGLLESTLRLRVRTLRSGNALLRLVSGAGAFR